MNLRAQRQRAVAERLGGGIVPGRRGVIAEFVAKRTGARTEDMIPQLIAYAALGAAVAAYEQWLRDEGEELEPLLDVAMRELHRGFRGHEPGA